MQHLGSTHIVGKGEEQKSKNLNLRPVMITKSTEKDIHREP